MRRVFRSGPLAGATVVRFFLVYALTTVALGFMAGVFARGANGKGQGAIALGPLAVAAWTYDKVKSSNWSRPQRYAGMILVVLAAALIVLYILSRPRTVDHV